MWRIKNRGSSAYPLYQGQNPPAHFPKALKDKGGNVSPDFQQLLTGLELAVWLDSTNETAQRPSLEERVTAAVENPSSIARAGGLSLGESTHLVNEVCRIDDAFRSRYGEIAGWTFHTAERGRMTLPVWVDHVGSAGTRYVTGDLEECPLTPPPLERMPQILPPGT
jgi:CRISPR-associated protein Cas5t